jgi:hypothetical protein
MSTCRVHVRISGGTRTKTGLADYRLDVVLKMAKRIKPEIKLGVTVRLRVHSGEIVEGRVVYLWEDKSVPMVRVASGDLVYNVPARMLIEKKSQT